MQMGNECVPPHHQTKPIRVSLKLGIPLDVLPTRGLTAKQTERMERINDSDLPRVSTQQRDKEESAEERKARKQAIKEERKVGAGSSHGWGRATPAAGHHCCTPAPDCVCF